MKTLVLQHIACEPPGVFEDVLIERGAAITRVELDEGGRLPDWRDFDLIVAMGGPMSVNDESEHPWLVAEKRLIREAVQDGVGYRKGEPAIRLHMEAYLGAPETYDSIEIEGSPRIAVKVAGGIHGDIATTSIVINSIPRVIGAAPGLHTMRDLPLPSFFAGR